MNNILFMIILAAAPISECRGAIIYGLGIGLNSYLVFALSVLANIAVIPVIFLVLKQARFMELAHKLFGNTISRKIEKNKKKLEVYEELALLAFVAIPLPVTGAYTAALIAEILDMNRKKAFFVISLGVIIAAIIVFSSMTGILTFFKAL